MTLPLVLSVLTSSCGAVLANRINGEPGFAWLENMRAYSRMGDEPDHKDKRAEGGNPCLEQVRSNRIASGHDVVLDSRAHGSWVLGVADVSRIAIKLY
jgi:hypothetical protein